MSRGLQTVMQHNSHAQRRSEPETRTQMLRAVFCICIPEYTICSEMQYLRSVLSRLDQEEHRVSSPADGLHRLLVAGIA